MSLIIHYLTSLKASKSKAEEWWWCGCKGGVGGWENGAVGGDEGGCEIEWKQKNKSEYGTCDRL